MNAVGIIGVGTIGGAIAQGLRETQSRIEIFGTRRSGTAPQFVTRCADNKEVLRRSRLVLLCVKPQQAAAVLEDLREDFTETHVLVSTCAGVTIEKLSEHVQTEKVARAMPNIACQVGEGMTALSFSAAWSEHQRNAVVELFETIGRAVVVEESHFDAVTALSGCGPAYLYTIIEALSDGGVRQGLPRPVARLLAAQTVLGSAKLVLETNAHPAELRDRVTTPAGCTIDALARLEEGKLRSTLIAAVAVAAERSAAISSAVK